MRTRSLTFLAITALAATCALAVAGSAFADAGSGDTSTKPPVDTSTKPPVDTEAPPKTELPKPPVTETPKPPSTEEPVTTPEVVTPDEPKVPNEPSCLDADKAGTAACIPDTPAVRQDTVPGSGAQLPFTGPGDVLLAIVIGLIAGTGGILFLFGASGREQLDVLNKRGMDSPSGFQLAYRELRKEQVER